MQPRGGTASHNRRPLTLPLTLTHVQHAWKAPVDSFLHEWLSEWLSHEQVYELCCGRTGLYYVATPPTGVPAAALVAAAVSRALGCPLPLPLAPLFECGEAALETVQDVLLPSRGAPQRCRSISCRSVGGGWFSVSWFRHSSALDAMHPTQI